VKAIEKEPVYMVRKRDPHSKSLSTFLQHRKQKSKKEMIKSRKRINEKQVVLF
jgi:hypothetical protein